MSPICCWVTTVPPVIMLPISSFALASVSSTVLAVVSPRTGVQPQLSERLPREGAGEGRRA